MKKLELRNMIREELQKLYEVKYKENDVVIYYPYGKNKDSIEVYIDQILDDYEIKLRHGQKNDKYLIRMTKQGKKDEKFMGFNFDEEDGELVSEKELSGPIKKQK